MQKIQRFSHLVENVLSMPFSENVLPDKSIQIDVHVLEHQIDVLVVLCLDDLFQFDDIGVTQFHQKHDFPVSPLSISGVIESIEVFLEGFYFMSFLVSDLPDVTVGTTSYLFNYVETSQNMRLYVLTH